MHFGQPEPRARIHNAIMAAQRKLQPAPQGRTVDRCNDRFLAGFDQIHQMARHRTNRTIGRIELPNIRTATEIAAQATNHDSFDRRLRLGVLDQLGDGQTHVFGQRVDRRIVD